MDGALVILFQAAFSLAVYCVAEALCKTVICMDGMLANSLTAFASAAYCADGAHQKTTVCIDGTLAIFLRFSSLTRWVLCGRFAAKKCDLYGRNSRHFFCRPLVACFFGSTIHRDHVTSCYDFSFKWFHFDVILTSFWSHFGVILGSKMV